MSKPIRVAVVDPYPIFREAVVQTITRNDDLLLVAEGATAAEARAAVREAEPDVMLIDISIPEGGIEAAVGIARGGSNCKLVVLTALDDVMSVSKALSAGVKGYILKGISGTELVAAIKRIHRGLPFVTPELASRLLTDAKGGALLPMREAKLQAALSCRRAANSFARLQGAHQQGNRRPARSNGRHHQALRHTTFQKDERPQPSRGHPGCPEIRPDV